MRSRTAIYKVSSAALSCRSQVTPKEIHWQQNRICKLPICRKVSKISQRESRAVASEKSISEQPLRNSERCVSSRQINRDRSIATDQSRSSQQIEIVASITESFRFGTWVLCVDAQSIILSSTAMVMASVRIIGFGIVFALNLVGDSH